LRKYVQRKKRKMNIGEAFVGMKRRGSQLEHGLAGARGQRQGQARSTAQHSRVCNRPSQAEHLLCFLWTLLNDFAVGIGISR
jgi:hypothetical protein